MFRSFHTVLFSLPFLAVGGLAMTGCTDECERASDCLRDEVCYVGVCTPATDSEVFCQSDAECNSTQTLNFRCVAGRCTLDPGMVGQTCVINPACFTNAQMLTPPAQPPQTMTATTGTARDDRGAPMSSPVALGSPQSSTVNLIAQNAATNRFICVSINTNTQACELIQISEGDPTDMNSTLFQSTMCTTTLMNTVGTLEGEAEGVVRSCAGTNFEARAVFDLTIQ